MTQEASGVVVARRIYFWAGVYGLATLLPLYFAEDVLARLAPPPLAHPENFYGFLAVAIAWQVAFIVISRDVVRFRPLMPAAALEKFAFAVTIAVLVAQGRAPLMAAGVAAPEAVLGALFLYARAGTPR